MLVMNPQHGTQTRDSSRQGGNDHALLSYEAGMTPPSPPNLRRRVIIAVAVVVVLACVATTAVAIRSGWFRSDPPAGHSATVGVNGVELTVDGVTIRGPAGVAPEGTILTARPTTAAPPELESTITTGIAGGMDISLEGLQPAKPLELRFPVTGPQPEGRHAVLMTTPSDGSAAHLLPASFDATTGSISATINHLSFVWPAFIDLRAAGRVVDKLVSQTLGISSPRPDCAGAPATDPSGMKITVDGDYSPDAKPVVWPCLTVHNGQLVAKLNSNSPLPWRVRAAPAATLEHQGTIDPAKGVVLAAYQALATKRPYAEGLLIPGDEMSYRFALSSLPATIQGQADVGTWLVMVVVFAVQAIMALFHVNLGAVADNVTALGCLGDAVEAANLVSRPGVDAVTSLARAALSCMDPIAKALGGTLSATAGFVLLVLSSGAALVFGGMQGAVMTLTGTDRFKIAISGTVKPVQSTPAADPAEVRFAGIGEFTLGLTASDLLARGFANKGNQYEGPNAACVAYARAGHPLGFSIESATGRVLAINTAFGDQSLHTQIGNIRVDFSLSELRTAFAGHQIEEHFNYDFGQGSNGVIVNGPGGTIAFSLADAPSSGYASGQAKITRINGVGLPGHAPTNAEDGC